MTSAFIDANVILRFLTGDPPEMAEKARNLMESVDRGEVRLVIPEIVVAETVWVLQSFYKYNPAEIKRVLQEFLSHQGLDVEGLAGILKALSWYADKNIDLVDALIAIHMEQKGLKEIFSFDEHFERLPEIIRLSV